MKLKQHWWQQTKWQYSLVFSLLLASPGCDHTQVTHQSQSTGIERANELVHRFATRQGLDNAQLDENLDRSFGEVGFNFDPQRNSLTGRVYVGRIRIKSASAQGRKNIEISVRALNDPTIGGMFDRGGGHFLFDREKEILFLVKEFPLDSTSKAQFMQDMERLMNLAATWTMRWTERVINIAHGLEPAPTMPVTQANDGN